MERKGYQNNDTTKADNRKLEQHAYPEYVWVSYSEEMDKRRDEESDNSILERSNRFAL